VLDYDEHLAEDPSLIDAVAAAAGLSLQNERLTAEARAQYRFLEAVTDTAPSLLVNVDSDGTILNQNRAALAAAGLEDEELVRGRPFWDVFIAPHERAAARDRFLALAPDFPPREYEGTFTNAHGEERVIYWRSAPVLDESGHVSSIVAGGVDVTDRKRQEEELRASRVRLVTAGDEARQRLERNLHDGAQQRLVALSVSLRLAESKLRDDPVAAEAVLAGAREELALALVELRELARGIHPSVLSDRGLRPAVEALVSRAPLPVEVDLCEGRLPPAVEAASYYVVAEALTNVAKYANARSARVSVSQVDGRVVVEISDDGSGGADPMRGSGLRGLIDRVNALDGTLAIESAPGDGTRVRAEIPMPPDTAE
jgi:PAS domain S-box-containing protein